MAFRKQTIAHVCRIKPATDPSEQAEFIVALLEEISFFRLEDPHKLLARDAIINMGRTAECITVDEVIAEWSKLPELEGFARDVDKACRY